MNKASFPIFQNRPLVYLDNAATTQTPEEVLSAMTRFYTEHKSNIHRGVYAMSIEATTAYENARAGVARFINAAPEETIFTSGTTASLNLLADALTSSFGPDDEVVLTQMEHHANLIPWQQLAKRRRFTVRFVPIDGEGRLGEVALSPRTKIVSITHLSHVLGGINPVQEIARRAHEIGALVVVDAAQSVGHIPIDVQTLDCDFLVFSGHKMYGPHGIGVLYGKKTLLENMEPVRFGGGAINTVSFDLTTWHDLPWKFEPGTPPIPEAIGLGMAVDFLDQTGMLEIAEHERTLVVEALEQLRTIPALTIHGPTITENRGGIISFTLKDVHPHDLATLLDDAHVAIRGGHHCAMPLMGVLGVPGVARLSFGLYNTTEDIDTLVAGITTAATT
ncbi:MAG: cysteine desulfurase, partial [bacterium]|nr:cysteine desulfurase [bacterium]